MFALLLLAQAGFASPEVIEVWFLSPPTTTSIHKLLPRFDGIEYFSMIAMSTFEEQCIPMGDGCFHPQLGFVSKKEGESETEKSEKKKTSLRTFNAIDTDLIKCEEGNYFDIYCGKEKKGSGITSKTMEIWIDVSASLKQIDYSNDPDYCSRRSFVAAIQGVCSSDKVYFATFNTAIQQMGDLSSLCLNHGLNDMNRLTDWIDRSKARRLIIVTDINEYTRKISDYLNSIGAKMRGADGEKLYAADLEKMVSEITPDCK